MSHNILKINADFRWFSTIVDRLIKTCDKNEAWASWFLEILKPDIEVKLISHICGVRGKLKDSPSWTMDDIKEACSERALTGTVMDAEWILERAARRARKKLKEKELSDRVSGESA